MNHCWALNYLSLPLLLLLLSISCCLLQTNLNSTFAFAVPKVGQHIFSLPNDNEQALRLAKGTGKSLVARMSTSSSSVDDVVSRLTFRPAESKDIDRCYEIESSSYPPDEAATLEGLQYRQREANPFFKVCCLAGGDDDTDTEKIIGFVCSTRCQEFEEESMSTHVPDGKLLAIHSVVVDEAFRRKGIATFMLQKYVQDIQASSEDEEEYQQAPIESIVLLAKQHLLSFYVNCGFMVNRVSPIVHGQDTWFELQQDIDTKRKKTVRTLPYPDEKWYCKTEQFKRPYPEVKRYLEEHKEWVQELRENKDVCITSGYRVDRDGKPGGGGLMFLASNSYESAMEIVLQDPLVKNDCVDWELNGWIGQVGDLQLR